MIHRLMCWEQILKDECDRKRVDLTKRLNLNVCLKIMEQTENWGLNLKFHFLRE